MKKYLILITILFSCLYAENLGIYRNYLNNLVEYKTKLPKEIYNPFLKPVKIKPKMELKSNKNGNFIEHKIVLLAVFNNQVLLKIKGLGIKKWLTKNGKINNFKLLRIINSNSVLVMNINNKKRKVVTLQHNNIKIKVVK